MPGAAIIHTALPGRSAARGTHIGISASRGTPLGSLPRPWNYHASTASFTDTLKRHGITISIDGKGRCMDNIFDERRWRSLKYEEVYLKAYATVAEAKAGIGAWLDFYNEERQHQSLGYRTPQARHHDCVGVRDAAGRQADRPHGSRVLCTLCDDRCSWAAGPSHHVMDKSQVVWTRVCRSAECSQGSCDDLEFFLQHSSRTWWLAGVAGAVVGSVWNFAMSSVFTWRR